MRRGGRRKLERRSTRHDLGQDGPWKDAPPAYGPEQVARSIGIRMDEPALQDCLASSPEAPILQPTRDERPKPPARSSSNDLHY
jgi:hypothetical protein